METSYHKRLCFLSLFVICVGGYPKEPGHFMNSELPELSTSEERMRTLFLEARHLLYSEQMLRAMNTTDPVSQACRDDFSQIVTDLNRIIPREYAARSKCRQFCLEILANCIILKV